MLTAHQIKMSADLIEWKTHRALPSLVRHELIMTGPRNNRYEITQRGRNTRPLQDQRHMVERSTREMPQPCATRDITQEGDERFA
ncbi:hypothetical protein [Nocardia sp. NPDC004260]